MEDEDLRGRLWDGFARLQALLGGHARRGAVIERDDLVASVVPSSPDSPALNAAVALRPEAAPTHLEELAAAYRRAGVRRWGLWLDGASRAVADALRTTGLSVASAAPGMGADIDEIAPAPDGASVLPADLTTVGRVNDLAYGNADGRLERTLRALPDGVLYAYRVDLEERPAAVALALHHGGDCGVSFVATIPDARRRGLATRVMLGALTHARDAGCTTASLQATEAGQQLYDRLGFRRLGTMELWERRR